MQVQGHGAFPGQQGMPGVFQPNFPLRGKFRQNPLHLQPQTAPGKDEIQPLGQLRVRPQHFRLIGHQHPQGVQHPALLVFLIQPGLLQTFPEPGGRGGLHEHRGAGFGFFHGDSGHAAQVNALYRQRLPAAPLHHKPVGIIFRMGPEHGGELLPQLCRGIFCPPACVPQGGGSTVQHRAAADGGFDFVFQGVVFPEGPGVQRKLDAQHLAFFQVFPGAAAAGAEPGHKFQIVRRQQLAPAGRQQHFLQSVGHRQRRQPGGANHLRRVGGLAQLLFQKSQVLFRLQGQRLLPGRIGDAFFGQQAGDFIKFQGGFRSQIHQ